MDVGESLIFTHQILVKLGVPHALIGGMALSEFGYGRGTQDVDWLIPEEFVKQVHAEFLGCGFTVFHQSGDVLQLTGKAEVDFLIARRPISRQMIQDAKYSNGLDLPVVQVEDLIGLKIQAFAGNPKRKNKELSDIAELLDRSPHINWGKIQSYADHFNEWPTIKGLAGDKIK